jgi:anaerobic magnesium-protoporphyrin IX monomethyl ester cyclase
VKVLMVCTNTYREFAPAPLGASLVASRLRRDGHEVRFLDLMFDRSPAMEAARTALEFKPDLVCYSIRNVDNQSPAPFFDPLPTIQSIVSAVGTAWPTPTLLGGTGFTTFPTQFMEALNADCGIAGDDLNPISSFVASLAAGEPDHSVSGLVHRAEDGIRCNPFTIRGYADTVFDNWDFLDMRPYRHSLSTLVECGLVVRTGCPFECVYCDYYRTFGRDWVLRDPRQVAEEALALQRWGARSVMFADAGFNRPLDHAKEVLSALLAAGVRLRLSAIFEPGEIDEEFAHLFRRAGGYGVLLYANSLSDDVLARSRKPFQVDDVVRGADVLHRAGIKGFLFLTFGGPGETSATVEETLRVASEIRALRTLVGRGYRIEPQTELQALAIAEGAIAPDDDCFKATFYHSPATPPEMLTARLKRYQAEHRWDGLRAVPAMVTLMWEKFRP